MYFYLNLEESDKMRHQNNVLYANANRSNLFSHRFFFCVTTTVYVSFLHNPNLLLIKSIVQPKIHSESPNKILKAV